MATASRLSLVWLDFNKPAAQLVALTALTVDTCSILGYSADGVAQAMVVHQAWDA